MDKVRIDKWLWSVRIYKSRTIATQACRSGKVKINNESVKPSFLITGGEDILVRKGGFNFQFHVKKLIDKRVSAVLAQECYADLTPEKELNKFDEWYMGKASPEKRDRGTGRPTKRERREIDDFKEDFY